VGNGRIRGRRWERRESIPRVHMPRDDRTVCFEIRRNSLARLAKPPIHRGFQERRTSVRPTLFLDLGNLPADFIEDFAFNIESTRMVMHCALLARVQQIEHDKIPEDARDVPRQACRDAGNIEGISHLCRYIPIYLEACNAGSSVKCLIRSSN